MTTRWFEGLFLLTVLLPGAASALGGGDPPAYIVSDHAFVWNQGTMTDLGTLGGSYSAAHGINSVGQVVGMSTTSSGAGRAFLWSAGHMVDLGTLGGDFSVAYGINDSGQVVGSSITASGEQHAFLWSGGVITDLGTLAGHRYSEARAINGSGQVVGASRADFGMTPNAFLWQGGAMTGIGDPNGSYSIATGINAGGRIVGTADLQGTGGFDAVMWEGGAMGALAGVPAGAYSFGKGINGADQIAGSYLVPQSGDFQHAFLWTEGQLAELRGGYPYGGYVAVAVNDGGQVVGNSDLTADAYLWSDGGVTVLGSLAQRTTRATAINNDGMVVGYSAVEVPVTPSVPEPRTWLLLGAGLALTSAVHRRGTGGASSRAENIATPA